MQPFPYVAAIIAVGLPTLYTNDTDMNERRTHEQGFTFERQ